MSAASAAEMRALRDASQLFATLADETRLQLVLRLATGGPASISRLSAEATVSRQAITKHLAVLGDVGLAQARAQGRERIWELKPERLLEAQTFLDLVGQRWDGALERLKALVEE